MEQFAGFFLVFAALLVAYIAFALSVALTVFLYRLFRKEE